MDATSRLPGKQVYQRILNRCTNVIHIYNIGHKIYKYDNGKTNKNKKKMKKELMTVHR